MSDTPGARESNAGDDFHVLWAARRALRLIDPHSPTRRLVVEGIGSIDDTEEDDAFLVADLTEFEGGNSFSEASRTIISQLKYSTRHPDRTWTVARLGRGKTQSGRPNSLIYRMGQALSEVLDNHSREKVLECLRIQLVSNQPIHPDLRRAVQSTKRTLESTGLKATYHLIERLDEDVRQRVRRLYEDSHLSSYEFTAFLRVLDLSEAGVERRGLQRVRLIQEFGRRLSLDPVRGIRGLQDLIRKEALPEGTESAGFVKEDVFAAMGVADAEDIFPSPPKFNLPDDPIDVRDAKRLGEKLLNSERAPLIAHGTAGIGKTTAIHQLEDHLPSGSEVIIYDCFGDGDYLTPGAARHTAHRALPQIANQIAVRCGTRFLIGRDLNRQDLLRNFRSSLKRAGQIISESGGELVLVVDAAGNAIEAADRENVRPFIIDLLETPMPPGVRLVVTCRSHRIEELGAETLPDLQFEGFCQSESAKHLRRWYSSASNEDVCAFHERTDGNPRVQFYILSRNDSSQDIQDVVKGADSRPRDIFEEIFSDLYTSVVENLTIPEAERRAAVLLEMTRPAPLEEFANVAGITEKNARQYCQTLRPGLVLDEEGDSTTIGLRDEDFETYLRERLGDDTLTEAHEMLSEYHLQHASDNSYSARSIAEHLLNAGRSQELIELALNDSSGLPIDDPLVRLRTFRRRITLALRAALGDKKSYAVKLLLKAAEYTRGDEAVVQLIHEAPSLAVQFGDAESITNVYVQKTEDSWLGPAHMHAAATLARNGNDDSADDHLRAAHAWLRRRKTIDSDQATGWKIDAEDIAKEIEAVYWLHGPQAAYDRLNSWHPRRIRIRAAKLVISEIAPLIGSKRLTSEISDLDLELIERATILAAAWDANVEIDDKIIRETEKSLLSLARSDREYRNDSWAVPFAELAARTGGECKNIRELLTTFGPPRPQRISYPAMEGVTPWLKSICLRSVLDDSCPTAEDLLPEELEDLEEDSNTRTGESERERWLKVVEPALPKFMSRAKAIVGVIDASIIAESDFVETLPSWSKPWNADPGSFHRYTTRVEQVVDALGLADGTAPEAVQNLIKGLDGASTVEKVAYEQVRISRSIINTSNREIAFDCIDHALESILDEEIPAREKWELLIDAAEAVKTYDPNWAQQLFDTALEKASELDDKGAYLLGTLASILKQESPSSSVGRDLAARLAYAVEVQERYVTEREVLPLSSTVEAAAVADLTTGLAISSRWDDEDRLELSKGNKAVVQATSKTETLTPEVAASLLRFSEKSLSVQEDLVPHLARLSEQSPKKRSRLSRIVQNLSIWVQKDVPRSGRPGAVRTLLEWANTEGIGNIGGLPELQDIKDFLGAVEADSDTDGQRSSVSSRVEKDLEMKEKERKERARSIMKSAVEDAQNGDFSDLPNRFHEVTPYGYAEDQNFLTEVRDVTPRRFRTRFLNVLLDTSSEENLSRNDAGRVLDSFDEAIREWSGDSSVREWLSNHSSMLIEHLWPSLMRYDYDLAHQLRKILDLQIPTLDPSEVVLQLIARRIEDVSTRGLLAVAEVLAEALNSEEKAEAIDMALQSRENQTGGSRQLHVPESIPEPAAKYIWSALGHPDRRMRWKALHAARAIIDMDGAEGTSKRYLSKLTSLAEQQKPGAFRTPSRLFYWQSARAGVLQLLLRLTHEHPSIVVPHSEFLVRHALSSEFPHAQIREIARSAALALNKENEGVFDQDTLQQLQLSNCPQEEVGREGRNRRPYDKHKGGQDYDYRFDFDFLDTVPYWYSRLERRFDIEDGEVLERADKWICDEWGLPDVDWREDPRESSDYDQGQKPQVYKGDFPPIETERTHLTYHAMMCAAGEIVDSGAALRQYPESWEEDAWDEWLQPHLPARSGSWHHDHLSPTPLESKLWGHLPEIDKWVYSGTLEDYDRVLGLQNDSDGKVCAREIVVRASYNAYGDSHRDEDVCIRSALVTPESSEALLRAYQSVPDHREHAFPPRYHDGSEMQEEGFEFLDWIGVGGAKQALDQFDPYNFDLRLDLPQPLPRTTKSLGLEGGPSAWISSEFDSKPVLRVEAWSDDPGGRRQRYSPYSKGYRMWCNIEPLLFYLDRENYNLLIEVTLQRHERDQYDRGERKYDSGHAVYYLLRRDGTIRTMERDRVLRTEAHS